MRKPATKPAAKPTTTAAAATTARRTVTSPATAAPRKVAAATAPAARPKPSCKPAAARTMGATTTSSTGRKSASPAGRSKPAAGGALGSLYGPSPTRGSPSGARSRLEELAEENYDSQPNSGSRNNRNQRSINFADNNINDNDDNNSVGRHADLDDMEHTSLKDLIEHRERQHNRVKEVILRYNEDLQKRLDTTSALGSLARFDPGVDAHQQSASSPSPGGAVGGVGGGGRQRAMTVTVSTVDEQKMIEDLLKESSEEDSKKANLAASEGSDENVNAASPEPNNNNKAVDGGEGGQDETMTGEGGKPLTPRVGGVSRTALRAIIKHAQDTVNTAIDSDRERQAEFENTVLGRMQAMERMLVALQLSLKEQNDARIEGEERERTARTSDVDPLKEKVSELERTQQAAAHNEREQREMLQSQIEFVASDLQALAKDMREHQKNLEVETTKKAEAATKQAIDAASDRVRELCEAVERGLALSEKVRDDIPHAVVASVENVEASLHRAMQSEFDAQNTRLQVAEEHQAEVNKQNKEHIEERLENVQKAVDATLGDLRVKYDDEVKEHVAEVRKKAEEYEEARRAALPVPDTDRVKLMAEELENSLQLLKYLTEASSTAMTSTIPPRLERAEQKSAQMEAKLQSQEEALNELRHEVPKFSVAVGPDNLKDAWMGVSSYRAVPPPVSEEAEEEQQDALDQEHQDGEHPKNDYSPENMRQVHNQISEALRMIARRHASMSPLRGSPRSIYKEEKSASNNEEQRHFDPLSSTGSGGGGADAGASASNPSTHRCGAAAANSNQKQEQLFSSGSADTLPAEFESLSPREQLESINQVTSAKRAQLLTVQKVLSNIQHAFHELTMQEADIMAQSSPSRLAPTGGTPRTVAEYQHNRKICDEIAARKQRMYEKERLIVEKRNKLSREIESLQERENGIFRTLSAKNSARGQY